MFFDGFLVHIFIPAGSNDTNIACILVQILQYPGALCRRKATAKSLNVMKFPCSLLLLGLVLPAYGQPYFVAPAGNDANPGTLERPFASLGRAQEAVRQKPGSVWLRGGTYYLPEKLGFTAQDSGTKAAPVVYQAYGREQPVISGGIKLEKPDWQSIHAAGLMSLTNHHYLATKPNQPGPATVDATGPTPARPRPARAANVSNGKRSNETRFAAQGGQWRRSIGRIPEAVVNSGLAHLTTFAWVGGVNPSIASASLRR